METFVQPKFIAPQIVSIESLEIIKNYALAVRFDELTQLEDGWYEGQGIAPTGENFDLVAKTLINFYPENLPLPSITPTQTGDLLLEWDAPGNPSVDIALATMRASFHAFGPDDTDLEKDFSLLDNQSRAAFFAFLSANIKTVAA